MRLQVRCIVLAKKQIRLWMKKSWNAFGAGIVPIGFALEDQAIPRMSGESS
jgi:hypothetical protein